MSAAAIVLALSSFVVVTGAWISYMASIPRGDVPVKPTGYVVVQALGAGLAAGALLWGARTGTLSGAVIGFAAPSLALSGFFLWLLSQRKTPLGDLQVRVGDELLPFASMTSTGAPFDTSELAGQRVLFKFFRGGW